MSDQYIGEIRAFPFNFAPYGWLQCLGQILPVQQYTPLFALLGTNYGGNGTTNFGLPNLQGQVPIGWGQGTNLSNFDIGATGGTATETLSSTTTPTHSHNMQALPVHAIHNVPAANSMTAQGHAPGRGGAVINLYTTPVTSTLTLRPTAVGNTGGSGAHNNMQPYLAINWCIAFQGNFPTRG